MPCSGSALDAQNRERFEAQPAAAGLDIVYDDAHFRCQQPVEAYARKTDARLDVLVQPVDMHPDKVAECDCLYRIELQVPAVRGAYDFGLYRRWDDLNDPNPAVEVGRSDVAIP